MNVTPFLHKALQKLAYRQRAYQSTFATGGMLHQVLVDLAKFSAAFEADGAKMSHDRLLEMHGRRQVFFRILHHLSLTPEELEQIYRPALVAAAQRLQTQQRTDND